MSCPWRIERARASASLAGRRLWADTSTGVFSHKTQMSLSPSWPITLDATLHLVRPPVLLSLRKLTMSPTRSQPPRLYAQRRRSPDGVSKAFPIKALGTLGPPPLDFLPDLAWPLLGRPPPFRLPLVATRLLER